MRMVSVCWRWVKNLGITLGVVLVSLIVLGVLTRFFSPWLLNSRALAENMLSHSLKHPVSIQKLTIQWVGLEPFLTVDQVQIQDEATHQRLLTVAHVRFGLDLWQSFLQRQWVPGELHIKGASVRVVQQAGHVWKLLGVEEVNLREGSKALDVKHLMGWLRSRGNVSIQGVTARVSFFGGPTFELQEVSLQAKRAHVHPDVLGSGYLRGDGVSGRFAFGFSKGQSVPSLNKPAGIDFFLTGSQFSGKLGFFLGRIMKTPPVSVTAKNLSVALSGKWSRGAVLSVRGRLGADQLVLKRGSQKEAHRWRRVSFGGRWQQQASDWLLRLDSLHLVSSGGVEDLAPVVVKKVGASKAAYTLRINQLSTRFLKELLSMGGGFPVSEGVSLSNRLLSTGQWQDVRLQYRPHAVERPQVALAAHFNGLAVLPGVRSPGMSSVSGSLMWSQDSGTLLLNAKHAAFVFPYFFSARLPVTSLKARVQWHRAGNVWLANASHVVLKSPIVNFSGRARAVQGVARKPVLQVSGHFDAQSVAGLLPYVPRRGVSPTLRRWLQGALQGGKVTAGVLALTLPFSSSTSATVFSLGCVVDNLGVHYAPGWPDVHSVSGRVTFDGHKMSADLKQVVVEKGAVKGVQVSIPDVRRPLLHLGVNATVALQTVLGFLGHSPLSLGRAVADWQGEGSVGVRVRFDKDLRQGHEASSVKGALTMRDNVLALTQSFPPFKHLTGTVHVNNDRLTAAAMSAQWLGGPLHFSAGTTVGQQGKPSYVFPLTGQVDLKKMPWRIAGLNHYQGPMGYAGKLLLADGPKQPVGTLSLHSNLQGVTIGLPFPFGKKSSEKKHVRAVWQFGRTTPDVLRIDYGRHVHYVGQFVQANSGPHWLRAGLQFGMGDPLLPKANGLLVGGFLKHLDLDAYLPCVRSMLKGMQGGTSGKLSFGAFPVKVSSLEVKRLRALHRAFGHTFLMALFDKSHRQVCVNNRQVVGTLSWPAANGAPWQVALKRLSITTHAVVAEKQQTGKVEAPPHLNPAKLPSLDITCQHCVVDHRELGRVTLLLRHVAGGVSVKTLRTVSSKNDLYLKGSWVCREGKCVTDVYGHWSTQDLGGTLRQWEGAGVIGQGHGQTWFSLNWPGSPYQVNWAHLMGHVNFHYADGRILKLSRKTENRLGLGRFLNALSLQSLPVNVFSGFAHLGRKGFEFNRLQGVLSIKQGVGHSNLVKLEGPLAWVRVKGLIDFKGKRYDLNLKVIPNMTASLPVIVGLAGGPIAGAVTWLANKVLAIKIGQVAERRYRIQGSMGHPTVSEKT